MSNIFRIGKNKVKIVEILVSFVVYYAYILI